MIIPVNDLFLNAVAKVLCMEEIHAAVTKLESEDKEKFDLCISVASATLSYLEKANKARTEEVAQLENLDNFFKSICEDSHAN